MSQSTKYSGLLFPKGPTAKQLRERRRREMQVKDRAFQQIPEGATCFVQNKDCCGDLIKHHRISRRVKKYRHDDRNTFILCFHHHEEIERIEEKRFFEKHNILQLCPACANKERPKTGGSPGMRLGDCDKCGDNCYLFPVAN